MVVRRQVVFGGVAAAACVVGSLVSRMALAQTAYPKTVGILQRSRASERIAYRRYAAFTKQARADGYAGIAYLFTALATAELIHEQNFEKTLARLGIEITPLPEDELQVGSTKQNLITAAATEIQDVSVFYPNVLTELKPEGFQDAITMATYAWETEKQHLDILKSIQRWTPNHFEVVARKIDNETGQYFVCQICGSTTLKIPKGKCSICNYPSEHFRKIEPPV